MPLVPSLRDRARALKRETVALFYALRHPDTPLLARLVLLLVVSYALSPIDLIPDIIPVLGLLDDLLLVPLGIALALRLVPAAVMVEARAQAAAADRRPVSYGGAALIVLIWLSGIAALAWWLWPRG